MTFKIKADLLKKLRAEQDSLLEMAAQTDAIVEELRGVKDDLQADFDDKSERWQEGERGEATSTWLDELENLISDHEDFATTIRERADALGDIQEAPEY